MCLSRTGVAEQNDRLAGVHVPAGGEVPQRPSADGGCGVDVEVGEAFEAGKLGFVDAAGAASVGAVVDLGGEDLGQEPQVGLAFPGGDLGQSGGFGPDCGWVEVGGGG